MPFITFISFDLVHIFEHKYYCSFLLLNLGLHSHMLVLNYRQNWIHGYRSLVIEKEGGSGFYDNQIFALVYHWEGGGPVIRAEEAVQILFARVLLLSAPDCIIQTIANGSLYYRKIFKAWEKGKYSTNQL